MKRILLTAHKFFPQHKAGTEVLTLKVAQGLMQRNYEVMVVACNPPDQDARHMSGPETSDYVYEGVPVHIIEEPLRLKNYTFEHEYWHPEIQNHFEQVLEKFKPDLVHLFHAQNLSASIIEATVNKNIPAIFSAMDFWFVCPIVQLKRPDGAICRGPSKFALNCLTCYTPELFPPAPEFEEALNKKYPQLNSITNNLPSIFATLAKKGLYTTYIASKLYPAIKATVKRPLTLQEAANKFQAIMVPTKLMRDIFIENGISSSIIHHVPFGIDTKPLINYQTKTKSKILRFGFIGTLFEHKGVDLLVEAFQALPRDIQANLTIYGNLNQFPDYTKKLQTIAAKDSANSDKITFAGTFPNDKLGEVLTNIDVLVVPSRWYENTPLVIQSALACKTPLIATDLGGMSELIKHEVNGLLFNLNDAISLKDQMLKLIENPALLAEFQKNIEPERTIEQMIDDIESIYNKEIL